MDEAFWNKHRGLLTLDTDGHIFFTRRGKDLYGTRFAKAGKTFGEVMTRAQFELTLQDIEHLEQAHELEAKRKQLDDPATPDEEKRYLRRLLGIVEEPALAKVLDINEARRHRSAPGQR